MKVQAIQTNTNVPAPKHVFTNLEFKVKPNMNKTKFLQARMYTCADVNIMPVSIYKYLFKDKDYVMIAPSVLQLGTYINKKVNVLESCNLYIIHPDTRCITEVTFFVPSNEGSILISCSTSLALGLIQSNISLDNSPPGSNVVSSSADQPRNDNSQLNVHMLWEKSKTKLKENTRKISDVCSIQEQSATSSNKEQFYDGCSKKEVSNTTCTGKNGDKNCQADKSDMPVKPAKDMWSNGTSNTNTESDVKEVKNSATRRSQELSIYQVY